MLWLLSLFFAHPSPAAGFYYIMILCTGRLKERQTGRQTILKEKERDQRFETKN